MLLCGKLRKVVLRASTSADFPTLFCPTIILKPGVRFISTVESLWVAFPAACGATLLGKSPVWSTIGLIPRRLRRGGFI